MIIVICEVCAGEELPEGRQAGISGSGRHEPCCSARGVGGIVDYKKWRVVFNV
jgi:hypothetical protein